MATQMTRAEYEAKYGFSAIVPPKSKEKTPFVNKVANFFGAKGITEQFGADIARARATEAEKGFVEYPTMKKVVGSAIQSGANLIPGAGKGVGLIGKIATGAGTGLAFDVGSKLQTDKSVQESLKPGLGTVVGAATPVAVAVAKPALKIIGRLFKGLGSGLSGVSTEAIDNIVKNPKAAQEASKKLAQGGNAKMLEDNAKQILNGVSSIRQTARKAYGEGLEALAETDIKPAVFREQTQQLLDKYGFSTSQGVKTLGNAEFNDPKNIQKAIELTDKLNTVSLNGKSIRKLADDIESSAYKIATSDERLSFNAFINDLSGTLKKAISNSTGKLNEINASFSQDMQLAQAVQDIFGKVNYKNLSEVVKASKKLESVFAQKGLAPDVIDRFLSKIGVNPAEFRTGEAVRQITQKASGVNTKGLTFAELTQQATSAIFTPQMVRDIAVKVGMAEQKLLPELNKLSQPVRNLIMNALMQGNR